MIKFNIMNYIIIQLSGGIGNQLFQLGNAYQLALNFKRELLICDKNPGNRKTYWDSLLLKFKNKLITVEKYKELKQKAQIYNWAMTRFEYKNIELDPKIECFCIEGYYQSYKYFDRITFDEMLNFEGRNLILNDNTVAIHIRRTDYANNKNFHKLISLDYYYNCLKLLRERSNINDINEIYVFSDDLNWCKSNFKFPEISINYVSLKTDIEELEFMSKFKNIIIANSSFSWWAAYLNIDLNKNIYCPKNWFNNGCHLNTKDLRPDNWIIMDDDLPSIPITGIGLKERSKTPRGDGGTAQGVCGFSQGGVGVSPIFNIISLGSACCMVQNIHDNMYKDLGPLFRQGENATNFFDWLICDFRFISFVFENLMFKDDSFLCSENFTINDVNSTADKLRGGWSNVYRKIEFNDKSIGTMISLHDVKKECTEVPNEFFEKYKRRFERLYNKIVNHDTIHLLHCFDFQWLNPYFPHVNEIEKIFESCKIINPMCKVKLYFFIHPNYNPNKMTENKERFDQYKYIENVEVFYLKDKGWKDDWKAGHLTFDEFFN